MRDLITLANGRLQTAMFQGWAGLLGEGGCLVAPTGALAFARLVPAVAGCDCDLGACQDTDVSRLRGHA